MIYALSSEELEKISALSEKWKNFKNTRNETASFNDYKKLPSSFLTVRERENMLDKLFEILEI